MAACLFLLVRLEPGQGVALLWQVPALVVLWVVYGWVLVGLFCLGHECGHGAFSSRRWVNELMGYALLSPLLNGFHTWRLTHNHHHSHTQLRGQEVDWASHLVTREELDRLTWRDAFLTKLGYAVPFGPFLWIACNTLQRGLLVRRQLGPEVYARERGRLLLSNAIMLALGLGVYGGLWYGLGFWPMMKLHGIPGAVAMATGTLIITLQHANERSLIYDENGWTPLRGQLVSTFDIRFPRWIEHLWCDINIHIPHHVAPTIPWYHLREASRLLRCAFPAYYQERVFSWHDLWWFVRSPLLRHDVEKGYYTMEKGAGAVAPAAAAAT